MFDNWMKRTSVEEVDSGCIYISGAVEFDDRAGPVRDALANSVLTWQAAVTPSRSLQEMRRVRPDVSGTKMLLRSTA